MRSWRAESKSTVSRVQSLRKMNKKKKFEDKGRDAVALSTPTIRHSSCRSLDADSCSVNNFLFRIGLSRSWLHYFQEINLLICGNLPREPCVFRRVLSNSRFDSPTFLGGSEAICSMHPPSHQNTGQHQNNTSQNKEKKSHRKAHRHHPPQPMQVKPASQVMWKVPGRRPFPKRNRFVGTFVHGALAMMREANAGNDDKNTNQPFCGSLGQKPLVGCVFSCHQFPADCEAPNCSQLIDALMVHPQWIDFPDTGWIVCGQPATRSLTSSILQSQEIRTHIGSQWTRGNFCRSHTSFDESTGKLSASSRFMPSGTRWSVSLSTLSSFQTGWKS